jgi:hypothetical protein
MGIIPHFHLAGRARPSKVETSTAWTEAKPFARREDSDKLRYRRLDGATGLDHWKTFPARAAIATPPSPTR